MCTLAVICYTVCKTNNTFSVRWEKVNLLQIDWIFDFWQFLSSLLPLLLGLYVRTRKFVSFECWTNIDTRTSNFIFGSSILNARSWSWHLYSNLHFRTGNQIKNRFFTPPFLAIEWNAWYGSMAKVLTHKVNFDIWMKAFAYGSDGGVVGNFRWSVTFKFCKKNQLTQTSTKSKCYTYGASPIRSYFLWVQLEWYSRLDTWILHWDRIAALPATIDDFQLHRPYCARIDRRQAHHSRAIELAVAVDL